MDEMTSYLGWKIDPSNQKIGQIMTSRTLIAGLATVWLAVAQLSLPAVAVGQELWHGATVGMSVAEVRKLFPVVQPIEEPDPTRAGWVALLRADKAPIDGLRQTVTFTFKNGELISVVTSAGGRPDPTALNPQEVQQILATLQSKYGQPVRCKGPDNNMLLACFWRGNGVFVGYMGRTDPLPMALTFFHAWEEQDGALLQ